MNLQSTRWPLYWVHTTPIHRSTIPIIHGTEQDIIGAAHLHPTLGWLINTQCNEHVLALLVLYID